MKRFIVLLGLVALLTASCLYSAPPPSGAYRGGAVGAGVGGVAGAILDHRNPWRGGLIGGALGAVLGATLGDISDRAARESVQYGGPVEYRTEDGRGVYRAEPMGPSSQTNCEKVRERAWEDGRLVRDEVKEVCRGTKTEPGY